MVHRYSLPSFVEDNTGHESMTSSSSPSSIPIGTNSSPNDPSIANQIVQYTFSYLFVDSDLRKVDQDVVRIPHDSWVSELLHKIRLRYAYESIDLWRRKDAPQRHTSLQSFQQMKMNEFEEKFEQLDRLHKVSHYWGVKPTTPVPDSFHLVAKAVRSKSYPLKPLNLCHAHHRVVC